jgi:surface polysaccharide O-acyltransferase-like enzyme
MTYRVPLDRDPPLADLSPITWLKLAAMMSVAAFVLVIMLMTGLTTFFQHRYPSDGGPQTIAEVLLHAFVAAVPVFVLNLVAGLACILFLLARRRLRG